MKKLVLALACVLGCVMGCGKIPPPTNATSGSESIEPEGTEPEANTPAEEPGAASDTSPPDAPAAAGPASEPEGAKPACSSLQKSKCKVTQGCAWYEQGGKSKCVDEEE